MEQYVLLVFDVILCAMILTLILGLRRKRKHLKKVLEDLDKLVSPFCTGPSEEVIKPTEDWRKWTPLTEVELVYPDGTGASFELLGNHSLEQVEDRIVERCAIDHHIPDKIVITLYRNGDKNKGENNE